MTTRYITSVFGDRHINVLLPLLYSIQTNDPLSLCSVYWEDVNLGTISFYKKLFPRFDFNKTDFNFSKDVVQRISGKTLVWELAASQHVGEIICFMDADMLLVHPVDDILNNHKSDIVITDRKHHFPVNSGIVLTRNSRKVSHFMSCWREKTQEILSDPKAMLQANSLDLPYGGADQMAMQLLIKYKFGTTKYQLKNNFGEIFIESVPCALLNETESKPITKDTHVIHYKGGWRAILFEGGCFTKMRSKKDSWEMYLLYITHFQQAILQANKALQTKYTTKDFNFVIPFYINPSTLKERFGLYAIFFIQSWLYSLPKRIRIFIRERSLF